MHLLEYFTKMGLFVGGVIAIVCLTTSAAQWSSYHVEIGSIQSAYLILALFPVTVLVSGIVALVLMLKK